MSDGVLASPIVSFERNGEVLRLGRNDEDILHLHGSTGLGIPPTSISSSDRIGGDGSYIRGVRYDSREVFIPLAILKRTKAEATEVRRELYKLLAPHLGMVTIRVIDPATGTNRTIEGVLKSGLEGDFGDGFNGHYQTLGLTFFCPEPWWLGEKKEIVLRLNPGVKPFISESVPFFPVILSQGSAQGTFQITVAGDDYVSPVWTISGQGTDPTISRGEDTFMLKANMLPGSSVSIDMGTGIMTPDRWGEVPLSSTLFQLAPGVNTISATMVNASADSEIRGVYYEKFLEAI